MTKTHTRFKADMARVAENREKIAVFLDDGRPRTTSEVDRGTKIYSMGRTTATLSAMAKEGVIYVYRDHNKPTVWAGKNPEKRHEPGI